MEVRARLPEPGRDHGRGHEGVPGEDPLRIARLALALGGLFTIVLGLLGTTSAAADGAGPVGEACLLVTVTGSTQQQLVVTGHDLDQWQDMTKPPYRTHSPGSTQDEPQPLGATSIPVILGKLDPAVPVGSVTFISARASANDHATRLGPGDLGFPYTGHTGFQGNVVPGFWADTDRQLVRFARPMRSDDDLNYQDVWTSRTDGEATLVIHTTGHIVHPQIRASTTTTVVGATVGLSATFADDTPPPGPTYLWNFGDGTSSTSPSPPHTWTRSGTYSVTLETGAADGSEGSASPIQVQVGPKPKPKPPPKTPGKTPGTGTGATHHPVNGPVTGTGTASNGSTFPLSGPFGTGGITTGTSSAGKATGTTTSTPSQVQGTGNQSVPMGTPVSGILLVSDATASASTASKAAPVPAASARAVQPLRWDRGLLWLLLVPTLLAVGGLTQTRWWTRRLPVLPWRSG
jgi:hypothetical protein